MIYKIFRPLIFKIDPEKAHNLAIFFLKNFPRFATCFALETRHKNLEKTICGLNFKNPIGMAAGFDKNAEIFNSLFKFGFGFVEVGTITKNPQNGNSKPRIFRLKEDEAIINRLGFNSKGCDFALKNLEKYNFAKAYKNDNLPILGVNIGKNKDSENAVLDYLFLLEKFYQKASYITINISSPNTKNLRDLQNEDQLDELLKQLMAKKNDLKKIYDKETPLWLKIAPDLTLQEQEIIARKVLQYEIDALIISNTTISRPDFLQNNFKNEIGGLSGKPLFKPSNEILQNFYRLTQGKIPLIGVGGISSANDVLQKVKCGASLVQIYSSFVYQGFNLVEKVNQDLREIL